MKNLQTTNSMKVIKLFSLGILLSIVLAFVPESTQAQKYGYVDTDYILGKIPEYADAQAELDELSLKWQKELETLYAEIDAMYKKYKAESVLLPEDIREKRENEIIKKEKEAKDLQKKRFGTNGDLFDRRQELVKPIQDKIFTAIEEIAIAKNYTFIFDKAAGSTVLYANPKNDISNEVLIKLGYSPETETETETETEKTSGDRE